MMKRILLLIALAAGLGMTLPHNAAADHQCAYGRITALGPNSISIFNRDDNEGVMTFTVDSRTRYTKWVTQGPWQQNIQYDSRLLDIGRLVAVHGGHDGRIPASWVQVATDVPYATGVRYDNDVRHHDIDAQRIDIDAPRRSRHDVDTPRHDIDTPRHDVDTPRHDVDKPRHDVDTPRHDVDTPRHDVDTPRHDVDTPRHDVDTPRHDVDTPRQDNDAPRH